VILRYFQDKISECKEAIKKNYLQMLANEQLNPKTFIAKLNEHYNFDDVIGTYKSLKTGSITLAEVNAEYNNIFEKRQGDAELEKLGRDIHDKLLRNIHVDTVVFEDCKKHINELFEPLKFYTPQKKVWGWDPVSKSKSIGVSDKNSKAMKTETAMAYSAVVGDTKMKKGKFVWEVALNSGNTQHQWISFGVIDITLVKDYENFPYSSTYGLTTYGQLYQMTKSSYNISEYDNKTYRCELNLTKGTFEIMFEANVVCSVTNNALKEKTMLPFVILYRQNNSATIKVIESVASS